MSITEKVTVEESFRSSLEDVKIIVERVGKFCNSLEDFYELVTLGLTNEGQLKILMALCDGKKKEK